jgi:hypothetical protein
MKPSSGDQVLDLLDAPFLSAALGAALELGLFWLLQDRPRAADEVAAALGIPPRRCRHWLQLLASAGLLAEGPAGYAPSAPARSAILDGYSQDTWALLAAEAREMLPSFRDLALHLTDRGSVWPALGFAPVDYLVEMTESPERARRFTRMLYEIHQPLADSLAEALDMTGVNRLMDLGGGSGVVSMALLRCHPHLTAVVVDIAPVCQAGREIAVENGLAGRITYLPADFVHGELPTGFDLVLECDVNVYSEDLFRKLGASLNPGGRLVIVDEFAPEPGADMGRDLSDV